MYSVEIKLLALNMPKKPGAVKATADVMVGPVQVMEIRVVENDGSPPKVRLPNHKVYETNDASRWEWVPYIILPNELKRELDRIVLEEYGRRKAKLEGG
jgi:hypothetical protein